MSDEVEVNPAPADSAAHGEAPRRGRPPKVEGPAIPDGHKLCRVLKKGDGKVSKGYAKQEADGVTREQYYAKGDEFVIAIGIAETLEDRGFVEFD